jgi:hypothetical protein
MDAFTEIYNKTAAPFIWTNSKVHPRRVKGRRLSDLVELTIGAVADDGVSITVFSSPPM